MSSAIEEVEPKTLPEFTALAEVIERGEDKFVVPEEMIVEPTEPQTGAAAPEPPPAEEQERPVAATAEDLGPLAPAPPQVNQSMWNLIMRMKSGERLKLALRGNKEARLILLRDGNKLIQRFVLKNPRITDEEVIQIARNRQSDADLLRELAEHKYHSRHLLVRQALVTNPKSPIAIALRFITSLSDRELVHISKSRNVSATIVSSARRILIQKGKM